MVVVVILGILAAIVVPRVMDRPDDARITKVKSDIRALESALNLYRLDNFVYPDTNQGLQALVERPRTGPSRATTDPAATWTGCPRTPGATTTSILNPGTRGDIDIYSFGADGRRGGTGINAEIGNWNLDDF
jgi:general secretion pathway protein G